jgi:hypothetical protein
MDFKELSNNKKFLLGVGAVVLLIILILLFRSTPEKTLNNFFKYLEASDSVKVADLLYIDYDDEDLEDLDIDEIAEELCDELEDYDFSYKILSNKVYNTSAKFTVRYEMDDDTYTVKIYLKKVNNKWKIDIGETFINLSTKKITTIKSKSN